MKKRTIMKILATLTLSAVAATSCFSLAACGGNDGKDTGDGTKQEQPDNTGNQGGNEGGNQGGNQQTTTHEHNWSDWTSISATQHERECNAEGHEGNKKETANHGTANSENKCPDCGYQFTTGGNEETATYNLYKVEDLEGASLAANTSLGDGLKLVNMAADLETSEAKTSYFNGEEVSLTKRFKVKGSIKSGSEYRQAIEVVATKATTVYVYAYGNATLSLYNDAQPSGTTGIDGTAQKIGDGNGSVLGVAKFEIAAGETKYIGSSSGALNVYAVGAVTGATNEAVKTAVDRTPATCETEGVKAHWISNYGVYYSNAALTTKIGVNEIVEDLAEHTYVDGVCSVCGHSESAAVTEINLKKLSNDGAALAVGEKFGTTWLEITTLGSKTKWAAGNGLSANGGMVLKITVTEASTLSFVYYSTSGGRTFTITKDGVNYAEGTYEAASYTDKTVTIDLVPGELEAGVYVITFDSAEHKLASISCVPTTAE